MENSCGVLTVVLRGMNSIVLKVGDSMGSEKEILWYEMLFHGLCEMQLIFVLQSPNGAKQPCQCNGQAQHLCL